MKITSLIKKTALAAAVASVSYGVSAAKLQDGSGAAPVPVLKLAAEAVQKGAVAEFEFPEVNITDSKINPSPSKTNSITLTLSGGAKFAVVPELILAGNELATGGDETTAVSARRVAGGVDKDSVTYELQGDVGVTFNGVLFKDASSNAPADIKLKNITGPVSVSVTLENGYETDSAAATLIEKTPALVIDVKATDYEYGFDRARIQVATGEVEFGTASASDFANTTKVIKLADIAIDNSNNAKLVDGTDAVAAGDSLKITYTLSAADVTVENYGKVYVTNNAVCDAPGANLGAELKYDSVTNVFEGTQENTFGALVPTVLCATVAGNEEGVQIPEANFTLNTKVDYVTKGAALAATEQPNGLGQVLRNGCTVTLFNLPAASGADTDRAYVRFTNTSDLAGDVKASVIKQNGEVIDVSTEVLGSLAPRATAVFHTDTANKSANSIFLGDVLPEYAGLTSADGRSRLVLTGAFAKCEALGMIRDQTGPLNNMSATVSN